jgi:hypothetical protein
LACRSPGFTRSRGCRMAAKFEIGDDAGFSVFATLPFQSGGS